MLQAIASATILAASGAGEADQQGYRVRGLDPRPISLFEEVQPESGAPGSGPAEAAARERRSRPAPFGTPGQAHLSLGLTGANDLSESTDLNAHASYGLFIAPDVEWIVEGGLWYHDQPGDDAVSGNLSGLFRWHFVNRDSWSLFADVGVGVLASSDNVPDGGTGINFTPRAGLGGTRRISDGGTRLVGGVRWHHVSNARIRGGDRNPARDAPAVYLGVMIPF